MSVFDHVTAERIDSIAKTGLSVAGFAGLAWRAMPFRRKDLRVSIKVDLEILELMEGCAWPERATVREHLKKALAEQYPKQESAPPSTTWWWVTRQLLGLVGMFCSMLLLFANHWLLALVGLVVSIIVAGGRKDKVMLTASRR